MQEKTDDIKKIQTALWGMYKDFMSHGSKDLYQKQVLDLGYSYEGEMKWFCRNLASAWDPVVELVGQQVKNGTDIGQIHACIMDIQNTAWAAYREFLEGYKVPEYTERSAALVEKYRDNRDMMLFAQTIILSWVPVINSLAEGFRNGKEKDTDGNP